MRLINYKLHRPTISGWLSFSRYLKIVIVAIFVVIGSWMLIIWMNTELTSVRLQSHSRMNEMRNSRLDLLNSELSRHPRVDSSDDTWKTPAMDRNKSRILSAYLDDRPELVLKYKPWTGFEGNTWAMIRVIAIIPLESQGSPGACYYRYRNQFDDTFIKKAPLLKTKAVCQPENFDMRYTAAFILCELSLPENTDRDVPHLPFEVTVSSDDQRNLTEINDDEFVKIHYPKQGIRRDRDPNRFMAACIPAFHHVFSGVLNIVEFVEFYRMMGVQHFTFYNESSTAKVGRVLKYYKGLRLASILSWKRPPFYIFEKTIRVNGIFAALNDCLYRSTLHEGYKYVVAVDVDEFIVPRKHDNYREMMEYLDPSATQKSNKETAFLFRNMFFYLMLNDDPVSLGPDLPMLYTQIKTRRWRDINEGHDRSKYIVRGEDVEEIGNHNTWEIKEGFEEITVDWSIAASQHYRYCETNVEVCWLRPTVVDTAAHRFTEELAKRVKNACEEIFGEDCPPYKLWNHSGS